MTLLNRPWHVSGIYEPGMLTRVVVPLSTLQELTANTGKVSMVYVKLDDPSQTDQVISHLRGVLKEYRIYSMEEFTSLYSVSNIPMLNGVHLGCHRARRGGGLPGGVVSPCTRPCWNARARSAC